MAGYPTLRARPIALANLIAFLVIFGLLASFGFVTAGIASRKGGSYFRWRYYGLILPLIALPHALLKRTKTAPPPSGD